MRYCIAIVSVAALSAVSFGQVHSDIYVGLSNNQFVTGALVNYTF